MSQAKNPFPDKSPGLDADDAPRSAVQLKTRPLLDRQLEQLADDCEAGLISREVMAERMFDACDQWAAPYLTPEKRAQVRAWIEDIALADLEMSAAWEHDK